MRKYALLLVAFALMVVAVPESCLAARTDVSASDAFVAQEVSFLEWAHWLHFTRPPAIYHRGTTGYFRFKVVTIPAGSTERLTYRVRIKRARGSKVLSKGSGAIKASTEYRIGVRMRYAGGTKAHPRFYRLFIKAWDASGNHTTLWTERFGIYK